MQEKELEVMARFPLIAASQDDAASFVAVIRWLSTSRSIEEVMHIVTNAARQLLSADGITFVLKDGDLCYYAEEDAVAPLWKGKRFPQNDCISGWCMVHRQAVAIDDIYSDSRIPHDAYRPTFVRTLAMVPVRQDEPIAAIGAYWSKRRKVSQAELELLQSIANAAALAMANVDALVTSEKVEYARRPKEALEAELSDHQSPHNSVSVRLLRRVISEVSKNSFQAYLVAFGCTFAAAVLRFAFDLLPGSSPGTVPFATFLVSVLFSTLVGGAIVGTFSLMLGLVVAWWLFFPPALEWAWPDQTLISRSVIFLVAGGVVVWATNTFRSLLFALEKNENERRLLTAELKHRARNTLAMVQAVVSRTLRDDKITAAIVNRRIAAVVETGALNEADIPTDLASLIQMELLPYGEERFKLTGSTCELAPQYARAVSLILHELATNAAKYGALSVPSEGCVLVSWLATSGQLALIWQEKDGPPISEPPSRGFGTHMINRVLGGVGGEIRSDWRKEGVLHEIRLPISLT